MDSTPAGERSETSKRRRTEAPVTILCLKHDTLCVIFSFLDIFDLARCSVVCKFWNGIINKSQLPQKFYDKQQTNKPLRVILEEQAMEQHRLSLQGGAIYIDQWRGHSIRADQCRMKMGMILSGGGDKVMRLWSLDRYKCIEEYSMPDMSPLVDFDFDESKIVGLVGTRICIWRRNGKRSIFPSNEGTFAKGLCMRYFDPDAVVGCEDGTARVFDMYSRRCSRIIRMHSAPLTCLCLSEDQMMVSGSSSGCITISDPSLNQQVATLRSSHYAGGISTLCFNPSSRLVFSGSTVGFTCCWDLRAMKRLWETRVTPNVIYSLQHLHNDKSVLAVGAIDGILRILNQSNGDVVSCCVMGDELLSSSQSPSGAIQRRRGQRLSQDIHIDSLPRSVRPPIRCLAVGMKKIVTTHNSKYISMWKFK
ncbi:hypothetical protein L6164_017924 [Bauhinia variegata]|uniref:Uncharacterized protein n=1 Tax=Bauhinia variegata TaxID=167791 RepID=A0ACB9N9M6_BAUVA|nr:hypothetical protein L6164_017924 [Bauhinia variegata]